MTAISLDELKIEVGDFLLDISTYGNTPRLVCAISDTRYGTYREDLYTGLSWIDKEDCVLYKKALYIEMKSESVQQ